MKILQVKNLVKSYPQTSDNPLTVIFDTSFDVCQGETVAITGHSGSGKTTLMALLAGLDTPDSGSVMIRGEKLGKMDEDRLARFRAEWIGIIFQQFHLMPHLTAKENIMLPLEILKYKSEDIERRANRVLRQVGLDKRKDHLPSQLSGGESQRVAIARALVVEPSLLLADEPTGNLDTNTGEQVADLLFDLVDSSGMTMIVVTHNIELAARCRRNLKFEHGRLQAASMGN
ncbi:putative transporter subunit: ATP-binding component of ABC superfamily [Desulfamplus magnetovallimortis]|uniref:Putative transporter subunit: ATP-binding component of ABC superfamily n=1 Tax=Desulfamplus magnetovallimortis TaxID=1246637 RepID=A0A1W1HHE1_9BACT|nr:ABC transporter ATP-binding protein [Desulfamplus magnetovallimortis]SLM31921.1 putative transporter subunit: ATP-binding component of ABC superfamily [Desulfamplus magnetovallimortis]